jgi:hypothetical protein
MYTSRSSKLTEVCCLVSSRFLLLVVACFFRKFVADVVLVLIKHVKLVCFLTVEGMDRIFWSSSDENENEEDDVKEEKQEETRRGHSVEVVANKRAKVEKNEESVTIQRLSALDKTGLEGTGDKIASVMANQKKG